MSSTTKEYGFNTPQRLFVGYTLAVLVDLTVLNFLMSIGILLILNHSQFRLLPQSYCSYY